MIVGESDCPAERPISVLFLCERSSGAAARSCKRDDKLAKFWLLPVREAYNYGFSSTELKRIAAIVEENEAALLKAWHEFFDRTDGNGGGYKGTRQ